MKYHTLFFSKGRKDVEKVIGALRVKGDCNPMDYYVLYEVS